MASIILSESLNDKSNKINLLTKREIERQLNLQKRKDDKEHNLADNEKLDIFQTLFSEKQNYIKDLIADSRNVPKSELPDHFNLISKEILQLQKYVAASNIFLRNYDLQKCQNILLDLSANAKQLENELMPKKKFAFKNKVKEKDHSKEKNELDEVDSTVKSHHKILNNCGFFNRTNATLSMSDVQIFKKDISLEKLINCTIIFKGSPSTLHLNYLKNCKIFTGPVSTSIFAENCEDCTLVIACQQLRLHSSRNINIYLHVTSRAIMEDCQDIAIAPYNWKYEGIEKDFIKASLDMKTNNWTSIDDFNWLSDKHSPNWRELEENARVTSWDDTVK